MKEIIFVTTNRGKIASAQEYLKNTKLIAYDAELIEPRTDDIVEIAREKVIQAYNIVKEPCIALDAGFFIRTLNGFPRAYVNHALETIGTDGILKLMEDKDDKECEFRSCCAYYDGKDMRFFESKTVGIIAEEYRGEHTDKKWSELWHIFIPSGFKKTLAEFNDDDFEKYQSMKEDSAIKKFAMWFEA